MVSLEAARHSGWLLHARHKGAFTHWSKQLVYLLEDKLVFVVPETHDTGAVRYFPLDRIPVRGMPRGFQPRPGIAIVDNRHMELSWAKSPSLRRERWASCIFSIQVGNRTHMLAAPTSKDAQVWVELITEAWMHCIRHPHRRLVLAPADHPLLGFVGHSLPYDAFLTEPVPQGIDSKLLGGSGGSIAQPQTAGVAGWQGKHAGSSCGAIYSIKTITGSCQAAATDARVYVELYGADSQRGSGQQRLITHKPSQFAPGCINQFEVTCVDVGEPCRVMIFHDSSGAQPRWFLEGLHISKKVKGRPPKWMHFPCGQWLAADQGDGRIARILMPRVIRVQHYNGMHDAAEHELPGLLQEMPQTVAQVQKPPASKLHQTSGDSCRSTKIQAVRPRIPQVEPRTLHAEGHRGEQSGKADIMQRYLEAPNDSSPEHF
ncbi:hypothetical protein WJX84_006220 [Apatococcus fuscideae]|uniref:PH domain-containing protein n=1 Tax=Apatococcus fuscideae TaxID=2026836 RepID=A0AAW1T363_9CHLO